MGLRRVPFKGVSLLLARIDSLTPGPQKYEYGLGGSLIVEYNISL